MGGGKKGSKKGPKQDKVWVCRGCCCGTRKKHPGVDHAALERQLREGAAGAGYRYEVTDCLGPCGQGNVVVVRTAGRTRWFRKMNAAEPTAALVGSLGSEELPPGLERHRLRKHDGKKP
jgi:(2Fe-2S) ferredoxin